MKKNASVKMFPVIKRILSFTKPYIFYLILGLLFAIAGVVLGLIAPIIIGRAVDLIVGKGNVDFKGVTDYLLALTATVIGSAFFTYLMNLCMNRISYCTVRDIRIAAFHKINEVPLKYIDGHSHGDIMSRIINDVDQISDGLIQGFTQLFNGIVTVVGTIVFMLTINVSITLVVVVITPLSLFVAAFIARRTHRMFKLQSAARGELSGFAEEMLGSQKVVKAFAHEDACEAKFDEINRKLYESGVKSQFFSSITNPATRFVNAIVYAAVGVTGALSVLGLFGGRLSIGQLSSFLAYANQYAKPFNEITGVVTELQTAVAAGQRVFELLDEQEQPSDDQLPQLKNPKGEIRIQNVSFSYSSEKPLIEGFNLDVKPGEKIAIVGPTGCGKTTLINLLMRFYDVDRGEILIDGENISQITRHSLRKHYGMVLQDSWLFSGTIRENIAYGNPNASQEEIENAAKAAHVHGFIERLPNGYDTMISDSGDNVSQGQKQLICIARVMLTDPAVLILDEATSSIDTRTEAMIQKAFDTMMRGRTTFIVAHRLSTIRKADKILVMNAGRIVEQGRHEELLQKGGFYAKLYNSQFEQTAS